MEIKNRLRENTPAIPFETRDYLGHKVSLEEYKGKTILLSFFRDASCPFCNLRLNQLIQLHPTFKEKEIVSIAFFSSSKEEILKYAGKQKAPFPIIPDPALSIYKLYRVEESLIAKFRTMRSLRKVVEAMTSEYFNLRSFTERNVIPADFLIDKDFTIRRAYYGKDFGDHMSLDEVLNRKK